ncbi:hypothetical protein Hamer_G030429 [Homarus americanus]|uniref:Uncharacterized protein n=1 Tax=Homarus americanus TaxID=6706 RepID=A0A8J5KF24_HOMAM|nr:hypothetical protein Hamer_G030429 [Homarus americanus]
MTRRSTGSQWCCCRRSGGVDGDSDGGSAPVRTCLQSPVTCVTEHQLAPMWVPPVTLEAIGMYNMPFFGEGGI